MCGAALGVLLRVVRDQMEERGVATIVSNKESTIWRKASVKTFREKQLKYTDVEEMRVVANDRHIAEHIKSDLVLSEQGNLLRSKVENVVMDESRVGKLGRIEGQQNLKCVVMDGPKVGGFGKVGREQKLKSIVMDGVRSGKEWTNGVKTGKVGKLEICKVDEEMWVPK